MTRTLRLLALVLVAIGAGALVYLAVQPKTPPAYAAQPFHVSTGQAKPTQPSSLWIGDSYTAGTGAPSQSAAESCLTATTMGWICNTDAEGGTGFINPGPAGAGTHPIGKRIATDKASMLADVVIIDAGRNDDDAPAAIPAAAKVVAEVRKDWPNAPIVFIAPYYMAHTGEIDAPLAAWEKSEAAKIHSYFIDPNAEGWITAAKTGPMTISDHVHPDPAGHRYIAKHLTADLKRLGLTHLAVTDVPS